MHASPAVAAALHAGLTWLDASDIAGESQPARVPAVFGPGDGNLANYLWDGTRVRVVDFEESGRSDRAYELAEITEHVSAWLDGGLDVPAFLGHFDLAPAESARLVDCRRLLALLWLFLLAMDRPDRPRNPPGTADHQARRLLALLDEG
ncbi:hypothetical protein GCM10009663_11440 [Kitasatospora arboriphila]|uniref:Aminoglycoside phosphotransferase domain-containing protein n=1 Tax=Kitasatospora arboriphila TaxID=258052 RepID=A0ABN1TCH6_9ACTN